MNARRESPLSENLGFQDRRWTVEGVPALFGIDQSLARSVVGAVEHLALGVTGGLNPARVTNRLDHFVSPELEQEPSETRDMAWVQEHSRSVRQSLKGSKDITKRLNGEPEDEMELPQEERVVKGAKLFVKILEQRRRSKDSE